MISTAIVTSTITAGSSRPRFFVAAVAGTVGVSVAVGAASAEVVFSAELDVAVVAAGCGDMVLAVSVVSTTDGVLLVAALATGVFVVLDDAVLVADCGIGGGEELDFAVTDGSGVAPASPLRGEAGVRLASARSRFALVLDVAVGAVTRREAGLFALVALRVAPEVAREAELED
jgi:hypothetical protein